MLELCDTAPEHRSVPRLVLMLDAARVHKASPPHLPALAAWLQATDGHPLPLTNLVRRRRTLVRGLGLPWPKDVTRHSFVSYHLARFQNAAQTALEAGHREAVLFRHYRAVCTPEDAARFWDITPDRC